MRSSLWKAAPRWLPIVVAALLIVALLVLSAWRITPWFPTDDAYISFRYADNWAAGHGPVFNLGERVEGYSNFLYVTLLALGSRLGLTPPLAARWLNFFSIAAIVVLILFALPRSIRRSPIRYFAVLPIVLSSHTIANVLSGLEAPLMAALLLGAVLSLEGRRRWLTPVSYLPIGLLRPEGAALALAAAAVDIWRARSEAGARGLLRAGSRWGLAFGAPFATYLAWRWSYYGYPLPNSVYAKMGWPLADALRISLRGLLPALTYYWPFLVIAIFGWLAHALGCRPRELWGVAMTFAAVVAIAIYTGAGDPYRAFLRYPFPALPLLAVMAVASYERVILGLERRRLRWLASGSFVALLSAQAILAYEPISPYVPPESGWARLEKGLQMWSRQDRTPHAREVRGLPMALHAVAEWLRTNAEPEQTVATAEVGIVPYYSGLMVLDTAGLVNEHIAHLPGTHAGKSDVDYVFRQDPDYFVFKKRTDCLCSGTPADVRIYRDPRFARRYQFAAMFPEGARTILIFSRRDRGAAPFYDLCQEHSRAEVTVRDDEGRSTGVGTRAWSTTAQGTISVLTERRKAELLAAIRDAENLHAGSPLMEDWVGQWQCWIQHLPPGGERSSEIRHRLSLPPGSRLRMTIGVPADPRHRDVTGEVQFSVRLENRADGEPSIVFEDALPIDSEGVFAGHEIDLSGFVGKEIDLVLRVSGGATADSKGRVVSAGWAGLAVSAVTETVETRR